MKILVDAMSGDNAPLEVIKGAVLAANEYSDHTIILVGDENNMYIDKEKALKYASQLEPVDDIASILKQPIKLAGRTQINRANNSIDIALGASIKVPGGFTLTVREKGVKVSGVTNWDNQKESQEASDMAGALATLLRNASGQMNHVGTDSSGIARWNENVEKVLSYFGIDASKDFEAGKNQNRLRDEDVDIALNHLALIPNPIDCGTNEILFLSLAALRDDSDYMQWFMNNYGYCNICYDKNVENYKSGYGKDISSSRKEDHLCAQERTCKAQRWLYRFVRSPSGEVYETFLPQGVVEDLLSEEIIEGRIKAGNKVIISTKKREISLTVE